MLYATDNETIYRPGSLDSISELQMAAETLHRRARMAVDFFHRADNIANTEVVDLDPRVGFVRLGETRAPGLLGEEFQVLRGLMNDRHELQAIATQGTSSTILTISDGGRTVTLAVYRGEESCTETLTYREDGSRHFLRACA